MKILVLTQQYPKKNNIYMNGFVHTRIKAYQNHYVDTYQVYVLNDKNNEYEYDGVLVREGGSQALIKELSKGYDRIIVHFLTEKMIPVLLNHAQEIEKFIWIHGYEALSWKRRLFNAFQLNFIKYALSNRKQLKQIRNFIKNEKNSTYIFVSEWMKVIAEKDIGARFVNYRIIPNGIDNEKYSITDKEGFEKNILLIRPFNSRKYATDIAVKAVRLLSKSNDFLDYQITIVGEGKYFEKDTKYIKNYPNVNLINRFLTSDEIAEFHHQNGIFLCPTRQDSQGVSMCEAMSSGLVVISSNNTAIPEFVKDGETGYLTKNAEEIVEVIKTISNDQVKFKEMSRVANQSIVSKCNLKAVIRKEIELVKGVAGE